MSKIDVKTLKPVLKPKNPKVTDPPRYPNVINGFENTAKRNYTFTLQKSVNDISKYMVESKTV